MRRWDSHFSRAWQRASYKSQAKKAQKWKVSTRRKSRCSFADMCSVDIAIINLGELVIICNTKNWCFYDRLERFAKHGQWRMNDKWYDEYVSGCYYHFKWYHWEAKLYCFIEKVFRLLKCIW